MGWHKMAAVWAIVFSVVVLCLLSTLTAPVLRTCIVLVAATELCRRPDWFCLATHSMGHQSLAEQMAMALCSLSTLMAPALRTCIVLVAAMGLRLLADWFYRATHSMGRHKLPAVQAMAPCLRS